MPKNNRINTPFTNEHFADWCLKMAEKKSPYSRLRGFAGSRRRKDNRLTSVYIRFKKSV
jgi:hypothetical protein